MRTSSTRRDSNLRYGVRGIEASIGSASRFNFKWGHRLIPDSSQRRRVFVTTFEEASRTAPLRPLLDPSIFLHLD